MFTVVIPLHNKEPYVKRCLDSILVQSWEDFEIIVIDDASKDKGIDIVSGYQDPRIKVEKRWQPGPGGYAARNLGIKVAKNKWIAFLDADDTWNPTYLEKVAELIQKHPNFKVFGSGFQIKLPNGSTQHNKYYDQHKGKGDHELSLEGYIRAGIKNQMPLHTVTLVADRKALLNSGGFPNSKIGRGGDLDTWLRLLLNENTAWGDFAEATYYTNIPNTVTRSVSPKHTNHHIYNTTIEVIKNTQDPKLKSLLKKYNNHYAKIGIKDSIRAFKPSLTLFRKYFYF